MGLCQAWAEAYAVDGLVVMAAQSSQDEGARIYAIVRAEVNFNL
jgi:hypothetical protein